MVGRARSRRGGAMAGGAWAWLLLLCCCCGGSWTQQRQIFAAATTDANDRRLLETFLFWDCISSFQFCYFFPWLVCWILLLSCIGPRVMQGAELDSLGTLCVFLVISITFLSLYTSSVNYFFGPRYSLGWWEVKHSGTWKCIWRRVRHFLCYANWRFINFREKTTIL
jgi:hypothetical protein